MCRWFDDGQDDLEADSVWLGPNYSRSLTYGRERFAESLCSLSPDDKDFTREQMLMDLKQKIVGKFDKVAGAVSVNEALVLLQEVPDLFRELTRERQHVREV